MILTWVIKDQEHRGLNFGTKNSNSNSKSLLMKKKNFNIL